MFGLCFGIAVKHLGLRGVRSCLKNYGRPVAFSRLEVMDLQAFEGVSFQYYKELDRCKLRMS